MNNLLITLKALWSKRYVKTILITAAGGAFGAVSPMLATGMIVWNAATAQAAVTGAVTAVAALYIRKPQKAETK